MDTGQMTDSMYGVMWESGMLMSALWIEWPMVAVGLWYGQPYAVLGRLLWKCNRLQITSYPT